MTTMTLSVPDISCGHCKTSIEGAVAGLSGIENVTVNIEPATVDLSFDERAVELNTIIDAIEDQGYEVVR